MKKSIAAFLKEQSLLEGKADNTLESYERVLHQLDVFLSKPLKSITTGDIKAFIMEKSDIEKVEKPITQHTKKLYISRFNTFFTWAFNHDPQLIAKNPVSGIKPSGARESEKEIKILSIDQMSQIIRGCYNPTHRIILVLLAKTGIREGELHNIDIGHINGDSITIVANTNREDIPKFKKLGQRIITGNKTNRERTVFLDGEGVKELQDFLKYRNTIKTDDKALIVSSLKTRMSCEQIWKIVSDIGKRTIEIHGQKLHPHLFRHHLTSVLAKNRCLESAIESIRGDKSVKMVSRYTHLDKSEVRAEYLRAIPKLGL